MQQRSIEAVELWDKETPKQLCRKCKNDEVELYNKAVKQWVNGAMGRHDIKKPTGEL